MSRASSPDRWALARVAIFLLLLAVSIVLAGLAGHLLAGGARGAERPAPGRLLLSGGLRLTAVTLASWVGVTLLDRRSLGSVGLRSGRPAGGQVLVGLAAGASVPMGYVVLLSAVGGLDLGLAPAESRGAALLAMATLGLALNAVSEELMVRGYLLQNLAAALGPLPAVVLTSLVFALAHAGNPNVDRAGLALIVVTGALLGWLTVRTGSLWAASAAHVAWNVTASVVVGLTVSGFQPSVSLLRARPDGPRWLTGGSFGFESSLVSLGVVTIALGLAAWLAGPRLRQAALAAYYRRGWRRG